MQATSQTETADQLVRDTHTFTKAGMGLPPFAFVGTASIPSPSLGEQNPTAYMNALAALPRNLVNGCGTCGHCGTPIMNIFIIRNAAGARYGVGCDCIGKSGDMPLVRASHLAKLKADRAKAAARKEAKRLAWLAEVNTATGETREQQMEREAAEKRAIYAAREAEQQARRNQVAKALEKYATALRDGNGGFRDSIGQDMQAGYIPQGRALDIAGQILGKIFGGRTGSKAHDKAVEEFDAAITAARAI